jgi:hypothetical protein
VGCPGLADACTFNSRGLGAVGVFYVWSRPERKAVSHFMLPVLGVLALAYPLYAMSKPGQSYPYDYVSWVVLAWIIAGIGLYLYYRQKSPKKIAAVGTFVAEDDLPLGEQPEALLTARATSVQHPRIVEEVAQHPEISDKGEH